MESEKEFKPKNENRLNLSLEMPIKITPSTADDGFIIEDANETEHFFYKNKKNPNVYDYDGRATRIK